MLRICVEWSLTEDFDEHFKVHVKISDQSQGHDASTYVVIIKCSKDAIYLNMTTWSRRNAMFFDR